MLFVAIDRSFWESPICFCWGCMIWATYNSGFERAMQIILICVINASRKILILLLMIYETTEKALLFERPLQRKDKIVPRRNECSGRTIKKASTRSKLVLEEPPTVFHFNKLLYNRSETEEIVQSARIFYSSQATITRFYYQGRGSLTPRPQGSRYLHWRHSMQPFERADIRIKTLSEGAALCPTAPRFHQATVVIVDTRFNPFGSDKAGLGADQSPPNKMKPSNDQI